MHRVAGGVLLALLTTGCTHALSPSPGPGPGPDQQEARTAAVALVAALAEKDLSPITFSGADGDAVQAQLQPLVRGMGPLAPKVEVTDVSAVGTRATADLAWTWTFPGVSRTWEYATTATFVDEGGEWHPSWSPDLVEPDLDDSTRLAQRRTYPERGELLGEDGDAIVEERPVVRLGIDKANLDHDRQESSARRLAKLVDIDADSYADLVEASGSAAFVTAIVFRAQDPDRPSDSAVDAVPGALAIDDDAMLPPTRTFAAALIGRVGEATAESVKDADGAVVTGDEVGLSGLQKRYDATMRGKPGVLVQLVPTDSNGASPSSSAKDTSSTSPSASPSASAERKTAFEVKAVDGRPLRTTMNVGLQELAEKTLARTSTAASLVAIRPSTGAVLAAADNVKTDGAVATSGQVQPGSTFKVASALALLRSGLKPTSSVRCPRTISVGGRTYENYDDYPSAQLGTIDFRTAFAQSCNTAFIGQRDRLDAGDLASAAASLGLGTDYDIGFPAYFGSVPRTGNDNARAEAIFGQGKDQVSPLAMACVAASVQAGHTVLPTLVVGQKPTSEAKPLDADEAATLKKLMRGVVTDGSGRRLASIGGPPVIAKTGTAEYGSRVPPQTHAWMIAAQGDLAIAVYVQDGTSGSGTAGPLLEAFLRGAR